MIKNTFLKSAMILVAGGFITKILGLVIKMMTVRFVGVEGTNLYMLILPTFTLFITISQLGFPVAVSKLIGEERRSNRKIMFSILPISICLNMVLMFVVLFLSPIISQLLHNNQALYPIMSIAFVLPFISISGIVRGYFFGKNRMYPHTISHIVEQLIRLLFIIFVIPKLLQINLILAVSAIVLMNIISETISIVILIGSIPKHAKITKKDVKPDLEIVKDALSISLPSTSSRIIGSITYFFEPIVLTLFLLKNGYSNQFILNEYGVINAYVMPLLIVPSFFTQAISSALIPIISKGFVNNHLNYVRNKFKQGVILSLGIGLIVTIALMIVPEIPLQYIFNSTKGVEYIRILAPFFLLYYIQVPIIATLQAINKAGYLMKGSIIGSIVKLSTIVIASFFQIGMYPLVIAIIINIIIVTGYSYFQLKKAIR